jgi:hypothetical protein
MRKTARETPIFRVIGGDPVLQDVFRRNQISALLHPQG